MRDAGSRLRRGCYSAVDAKQFAIRFTNTIAGDPDRQRLTYRLSGIPIRRGDRVGVTPALHIDSDQLQPLQHLVQTKSESSLSVSNVQIPQVGTYSVVGIGGNPHLIGIIDPFDK